MTITIDTSGSGATMEGTTRAMAPMLGRKQGGLGWRWSRSLGCWYLPRTLRAETVDAYVERTVKKLRAEGYDVEVVDGPRDDDETRAQRRYERDQELVEVHDHKAGSADAEVDALLTRAREMADVIPFGQPMMPDHYSYGRDRRYRDRIHRTYGKGFEAMGQAKDQRRKADSAAARVAAADWKRRGGRYGPGDIKVGWMISTSEAGHHWVPVVRVNKKSVTIPWFTGGTWRVPYIEIRHVAPDPENFELVRADLRHYARRADAPPPPAPQAPARNEQLTLDDGSDPDNREATS